MVRQIVAGSMLAAALGLAATCVAANAQTGAATDSDEARIEDLIIASHILANEGILDSFGHVTVRSAKDPSRFFMPRAMPPALISRTNTVELHLDSNPLTPPPPPLNR